MCYYYLCTHGRCSLILVIPMVMKNYIQTNTILSAVTAAYSHYISISSPRRDKIMDISCLVLEVGFSS